MSKLLERLFRLKENNTNIRTEIIAGSTTFMTMSYIIFVQPVILSNCGMDFKAVMIATCLASAIAIFLMAILANYPISLAPAMGHNVFFVYSICIGMGISWQVALGANFIAGFIFILLAFFGLRARLINIVPESLKNAIGVGIGLLIALIGFQWAGLVKYSPGTILSLGDIKNKATILAIIGTLITAIMLAHGKKAAIFSGIIITCLLGLPLGIVRFQGLFSRPPSLAPTFLKLDILGALHWRFFTVIFILFFLDLFDTIGTLIAVGQEGGFIKDGKLPRAKGALLSDAVGTCCGTLLGTSTVTSYIESSTGIAAGGRTGLSNIITGLFFVLSIFLFPLVKMIAGGYKFGENIILYPVIAPALIIVGCIMLKLVTKINWRDFTESFPAFITMIVMPFSFSITEGIAFGFISYTILKLATGRIKEVNALIYILSIVFILKYIFL